MGELTQPRFGPPPPPSGWRCARAAVPVAAAVLATALFATGCGSGDTEPPARGETGDRQVLETSAADGENVVTAGTAPVKYRSPQGLFAVTWPAGCNRLRTRKPAGAPPDDAFPGDRPTELGVYCDRAGHQGEGCAVRGFYNESTAEGGPPHPRMVTARIESTMTAYGVELLAQTPGSWGALQGVDVRCGESEGPGELWIRGILAGPHYYLLIAWNQAGGLFADPDYQAFFASFSVVAEETGAP
jgi:hypothetical protein